MASPAKPFGPAAMGVFTSDKIHDNAVRMICREMCNHFSIKLPDPVLPSASIRPKSPEFNPIEKALLRLKAMLRTRLVSTQSAGCGTLSAGSSPSSDLMNVPITSNLTGMNLSKQKPLQCLS